MDLRQKIDAPVVLITGCSSGIGLSVARRFAEEGYRVYASMRRPAQAEALRAEAAQKGWTLFTPALDVTSDDSVNAAVSSLLAETGQRIDVLVNNAGYYLFGPIEETSPDELRAQLETNLIGVLRVTRAVVPSMRARGSGAVVNISSVSGRVVVPITGPYHTSKWALEALTEALRYELIPFGVRVTCIEPGPYKTDLHTKEIQTQESTRTDSPYAPLIARYRKEAAAMRRAGLPGVVEVVFRAATHPRPALRWAVGPTSFAGTILRRLTPDFVYELLIRLVFRIKRIGRI
jgi:NAD(P)-dependent dehydrogenase (short-subunit alcohol dehydrogenase family)